MDPVWCSHRLYSSSPHSVMVILLEVRPDDEPKDSTFLTTSIPSFTLPKTTCLPSSLNEHSGDLLSRPGQRDNLCSCQGATHAGLLGDASGLDRSAILGHRSIFFFCFCFVFVACKPKHNDISLLLQEMLLPEERNFQK